ncbi:MAG TPA: efflux RND transporter periplasmic adaptor subunit [Rhizomicrobium sp.]|jgi:multidrug efflux system membrane fusion protein
MNIRLPNSLQTFPGSGNTNWATTFQRSNTRLRLILGVIGVVLVAALAWYLFAPAAKPPVKNPAVPVRVTAAIKKTVIINERTVGTVIANATVQITARVSGQLMTASFKEGDTVHKGDVLFQIDPRPFQAALEQAQATAARDAATLVSDNKDAERYRALLKSGGASQQQVDQAVAAAKAMAATVVSDRAAADAARLNLIYSKILSPIDGKTGAIQVQPGNLITADATTPLVTITQVQPVKVSFFLAQTDLPQIQQRMAQNRMTATIQVHGAGGKTMTAPVDFVGNAVDNRTGTIELRATFPNLDNVLVPGQLADVSASLGQIDDAVVVPHDAVNLGLNNSYVYVDGPGSKALIVPVQVLNDDGTLAAVKGQIKPGDKVVVEGQLRVVKGSLLAVKKAAPGAEQTTQAPAGAQ